MKAEEIHHGPVGLRSDEADRAGVPLFHAAWLFALGVVIAHFIWLRPSYLLIALAPLALLCAISAFRSQRIAWLPLAVLWCALGAWCAEIQPQPAPEPMLAALSDGLMRTVEGKVINAAPVHADLQQGADESSPAETSQRIDLRLSSIEVVSDTLDAQIPINGDVRLTIRWPADGALPAGFHCGDQIRADARLMLPDIYRDPGVWSRRDYLLDQGITSTASLKIDRLQLLGSSGERTLTCRISAWQHVASARLIALPAAMHNFSATLRLSQDDAIMLAAMVTGDRTYLTHSLRAGFERTGSFHMLVVSGLHLGIVAGCIFWITRRLRLPQLPSTLITITASFAYALFTGFATPVQRSLWMVSLYLVGRLFYRQRNVLNTIGFASLCLIVVSPRSLFDSSLQMTVLAVLSIGGIAVPLLEKTIHPYLTASRQLKLIALDVKLPPSQAQFRVILRMFSSSLGKAIGKRAGWSVLPWIVRAFLRCIEALVVSCVVELAMALPMAVYFHRITVFALPVNMIILPLLVVLVPSALITLLAALVSPALATFPAMITAAPLHIGVELVRLFAAIKTGDFRISGPLPWQIAAFCVFLALSIALAHLANRNEKHWPRRLSWVALLTAAVAVVLPRPFDHPHDALLVQAIDVGQGDSILLITPDGKTMLVDGGGFGGDPHRPPPDFDIGEEIVSPVLWSRGIRHLDAVALSHAHSDHMGGLPAILRNFRPNEIWIGNNPPVPAYEALLEESRELRVQMRFLRAGDSLTFGDSIVRVLAPLPGYEPGAEPSNNDSLVLKWAFQDTSVLLEGDAESPIESGMLGEPDLKSTLLKVGHHGSASSTKPEFLARVAPQWAIISCGLHNHYGHPRQEVLVALQAPHVRTFSTDINGTACFALDGKSVKAEAFCGMP
jgi:competence protein ComEC